MPDAFTRAEKRAAALHEVAMRRHVHGRMVREGKMEPAARDRSVAIMQAIADDYAEPDLFAATAA